MSRNLPWLAELQPEMFAEIDPVLAAERGIEDGGWMAIMTERAEIEARAKVTDADAPAAHRRPASSTRSALPWHWGYARRGSTGDARTTSCACRGDPNVIDRGVQGVHRATCAPGAARAGDDARRPRRRRHARAAADRRPARRAAERADASDPRRPDRGLGPPRRRRADGLLHRHDGLHRLQGVRGRVQAVERPARRRRRSSARGGSYDHTGELGAATWRHVRFVEVLEPSPQRAAARPADGRLPTRRDVAGATDRAGQDGASGGRRRAAVADMDRWIFMSDVCKHCTNAGCLDACPTGALIRTEFETVVAAARRLQRLRLLRPVVPVRRRRPRPRRRPRRQVHALLRPPARTASSRRARRRARPTRSSSAPYDELVDVARAARRHAARARARRRLPLRRRRPRRASSSPAGSARSSCSPSRPSATGCPRRPTRRSRRTSSRRRRRDRRGPARRRRRRGRVRAMAATAGARAAMRARSSTR